MGMLDEFEEPFSEVTDLCKELGIGEGGLFKLWLVLVRLVAPLAVAAVFVYNLA